MVVHTVGSQHLERWRINQSAVTETLRDVAGRHHDQTEQDDEKNQIHSNGDVQHERHGGRWLFPYASTRGSNTATYPSTKKRQEISPVFPVTELHHCAHVQWEAARSTEAVQLPGCQKEEEEQQSEEAAGPVGSHVHWLAGHTAVSISVT